MASALLKEPVKITDKQLCYFGAFIYALEMVDEKARQRGVYQEIKRGDGRSYDIFPEIPYHLLCEVVRKVGDRCWSANHSPKRVRLRVLPSPQPLTSKAA